MQPEQVGFAHHAQFGVDLMLAWAHAREYIAAARIRSRGRKNARATHRV